MNFNNECGDWLAGNRSLYLFFSDFVSALCQSGFGVYRQIKQSFHAPTDNLCCLRSTDSSAQPKFWGTQLVVKNQLDWLLFWVTACIIAFLSYQSFPLQKQESTNCLNT